jgi:hypothetical protein
MRSKLTLTTALSCLILCTANAQTWSTSGSNLYFNTGTVGIGTTPTTFKLTVGGSLVANSISTLAIFGYSNISDNRSVSIQQMGNASSASQYFFLNGGLGTSSTFGSPRLTSMYTPSFGLESNDNNLNIIVAPAGTNQTPVRAMSFLNNGNVLIGKTVQTNTSYILDVNGTGRFNKMIVNTTGADYVFDTKYQLLSMQAVEKYINEHHHLPGIQPASQMQQEGLNVGENQTALLGKIEELTLYLLQQNKKLDEQRKKIDHLEKLLRQHGLK